MLRTLFLIGLLGLIGYGVYTWGTGGLDPSSKPAARENEEKERPKPPDGEAGEKKQDEAPPETRPDLKASAETSAVRIKDAARLLEPLIVPDARISTVEFLDLASQRT